MTTTDIIETMMITAHHKVVHMVEVVICMMTAHHKVVHMAEVVTCMMTAHHKVVHMAEVVICIMMMGTGTRTKDMMIMGDMAIMGDTLMRTTHINAIRGFRGEGMLTIIKDLVEGNTPNRKGTEEEVVPMTITLDTEEG